MIINKKYLAKYSPLPSNYDFSEVLNYVPVSEKIWVIPVIGQPLYDEIDEQISTYEVSASTISDENATLLTEGGLWQYLAYATVLEGLPFIWAHISQVGITLGKSENSDSASLKDMSYIESHIRKQVEVLKDQLITWLDEHAESFPLYEPKHCGCNNSCSCTAQGQLNDPNKYQQMYRPQRPDTSIR